MVLALTQKYVEQFAAAECDSATHALYESVVSALDTAVAAIVSDDIEGRCNAVRSATETVATLYLHLDLKRAGEAADDLTNLYGEVLGCLLRINLANDVASAERAIELLEPLLASGGRRLRPVSAWAHSRE